MRNYWWMHKPNLYTNKKQTWKLGAVEHPRLERAEEVLEKNRYPGNFFYAHAASNLPRTKWTRQRETPSHTSKQQLTFRSIPLFSSALLKRKALSQYKGKRAKERAEKNKEGHLVRLRSLDKLDKRTRTPLKYSLRVEALLTGMPLAKSRHEKKKKKSGRDRKRYYRPIMAAAIVIWYTSTLFTFHP